MRVPASIPIPLLALCAAAGFVFGYGYFVFLRRCVELYASRGLWLNTLLAALLRFAAAALFFAGLAQWGEATLGEGARGWAAALLLATLLGFLAARYQAVRAARRLA